MQGILTLCEFHYCNFHFFYISYWHKLGTICFICQIVVCISPITVLIITMNFEQLPLLVVKYMLQFEKFFHFFAQCFVYQIYQIPCSSTNMWSQFKPCIFKFRAYNGRVSQGLTASRAVAKLHVAALINPQGPNFENGYKLACFFSRPLLFLNFSDHSPIVRWWYSEILTNQFFFCFFP